MIIVYLAISAVVLLADMATKIWIANGFELYESVPVIKGVLNFTNIANDGIAFGWLDNARWLFMTVTAVMVVVFAWFMFFAKGYTKTVYVSASLVFGGGLGNFIDRIVKLGTYDKPDSVVDFIDFCMFPEIWKWTFNVADVAVCAGVGLFILYLLAFDKKAMKNGYKSVLYDEKESDGK